MAMPFKALAVLSALPISTFWIIPWALRVRTTSDAQPVGSRAEANFNLRCSIFSLYCIYNLIQVAFMLFSNAKLATMTEGRPYGLIEDGAVIVEDGRIAWAGARQDAPKDKNRKTVDCGGRLLTPGLIDCHTHLVYGGNRANEFEMRLNGATYEEIARAGGGIVSTVKATRAASEAELVASAAKRLKPLLAEGVTLIEIKSGYGLDLETEGRQLRAARALAKQQRVGVRATCLAAHALPPEFKDRSDDYIVLVCDRIIPVLHQEGLIDA